jgi:DNA-binding CsgD family transcriptional regulator
MAFDGLLSEISTRIDEAVARESWTEARLGFRELARILVDATIAGDGELIARVDDMLSLAYADLSLDPSFEPELTATTLGWSASGLRDVSQLALWRCPAMTSDHRAAVLRDAETRILDLLGEGNGAPRSNRDIADRLKLNVATVARTLAKLRERKKVKSWPEGRFMMNQLAPSVDVAISLQAENAGAIEAFLEAKVNMDAERRLSVQQNISKPNSLSSAASKVLTPKMRGLSRSGDIELDISRIWEGIKPHDLDMPKNQIVAPDPSADAMSLVRKMAARLQSGSAVSKQAPRNPPSSISTHRQPYAADFVR